MNPKYYPPLTEEEFKNRQQMHIDLMRSIDKANWHLDGLLRDFSHYLNDQLIELKYGKGYKANFLDEILIQVKKI